MGIALGCPGEMSVEEARKPQMNLRTACAVGGRPGALWVSPDGSRLFAFDQDRPEVSVIGVSGWQLLERIPCGSASDERLTFLAGFGESIFLEGLPGMIHHFSAASHRADGAIPCAGDVCDLGVIRELRQGVLVTAGGSGGQVEFLNLSPLRTLSRLDLPLPPRRRSLALLPVHGRGAVVLCDPAREAEGVAIFDGRSGSAPAVIRMRPGIRSLAFEPSGRFLYAACHDDSTVAVIDVSEGRVVDQILMAGQPYHIACDPVGRRLW